MKCQVVLIGALLWSCGTSSSEVSSVAAPSIIANDAAIDSVAIADAQTTPHLDAAVESTETIETEPIVQPPVLTSEELFRERLEAVVRSAQAILLVRCSDATEAPIPGPPFVGGRYTVETIASYRGETLRELRSLGPIGQLHQIGLTPGSSYLLFSSYLPRVGWVGDYAFLVEGETVTVFGEPKNINEVLRLGGVE